MMVMQMNLEQLTALAQKVFVGRVIAIKSITDSEGRSIQEVTYQVIEMLKGDPEREITFRQLANSQQKIKQSGGLTLHSMDLDLPEYKVGEESVVFLSEEGPIGLTAPIGIKQGKFNIKKSITGDSFVMNGNDNRGLFLESPSQPTLKTMKLSKDEQSLLNKKEGQIPFRDFTSVVKKIVETHSNP